ncbi:MAG: S8 family serine peptidase [Chloroflexi bacterium]|nr:S8 family serine peptidase [Chloroflexota bacterium]
MASAKPVAAFVAGEILVKFQPGTSAQTMADVHRQNGGQVKEVIPDIGVQVVGVRRGQEASRVAAYLRHPEVEFAELNGYYEAIDAPNDPLVGQQWPYNNTGQTGGTPGADIDAFRAWDVTLGGDTVAIAILDTGIAQGHEDLAGKVALAVNFTTSPTTNDLYGHGTHVAGIAAALTNNGIGVAGTCPGCVLYNVKVLGDTGTGSYSAIAKGIRWAADNKAKVASMSFGGMFSSSTVYSAVNYAWSKGVVLVAAAGNSNSISPFYPAAYKNVIAVAATDHNDARASFSSFGAWVDLAAPGVNVTSTVPVSGTLSAPSGYRAASGTSTAAPHVAGVAGLIWSTGICSTASARNICIRDHLVATTDPIAGTGTLWAYGRLNAHTSVAPPAP